MDVISDKQRLGGTRERQLPSAVGQGGTSDAQCGQVEADSEPSILPTSHAFTALMDSMGGMQSRLFSVSVSLRVVSLVAFHAPEVLARLGMSESYMSCSMSHAHCRACPVERM